MTPTPSILLVSGWGATDRVWDPLRGALPERHISVVGWADALRDPSALRSHMAGRSGPWLLVGWSLGAMVALDAALDSPAEVAGLILIAGTGRLCRDNGYPGVDPRAVRTMQTRLARAPERVMADFAARCVAPDGNEADLASYLEQARWFSVEELTMGLEFLATRDLRRQAETLAVPTLLLHGDADEVVPLASARDLASRIAGARLEVFRGHGHALPLTVPDVLAERIRGFAS